MSDHDFSTLICLQDHFHLWGLNIYRDKFCIMIKCKIKEMHNPNWFLFWLPQMSEWQIRETRTPKQGIFTSLVQWRTEKRYCSMVSSSLFSPKTSLLTITFRILELLPVCSCVYFKASREIKEIRKKRGRVGKSARRRFKWWRSWRNARGLKFYLPRQPTSPT